MLKAKPKIILVAGARPNFMKIAPLLIEMKTDAAFEPFLVHTGQHYDQQMSKIFFQQLGIPEPDINLGVGSASHAIQTARIMERFEQVCLQNKPDAVMVVGDVNSTAACSLVASKMGITPFHYEAGLRSGDKRMPEEINRLVTDAICDLFFTTSDDASRNLIQEGHKPDEVFMCGNLMIDCLIENLEKTGTVSADISPLGGKASSQAVTFFTGRYGIMTFHRPSNVDEKQSLQNLIEVWSDITSKIPLIFPVHPRTWQNIRSFGLHKKINDIENLLPIEPVGYLQFIQWVKGATFVLTDSGGIQEETTYLNIPCLTLRPNTERPITILEGSNKLIKVGEIKQEIDQILNGKGKQGKIPKFWDGRTSQRIIQVLKKVILSK